MSDTTPILALPYPEPTDSPDGPAQMQALAEAVEAVLAQQLVPAGTVRWTVKTTPDTGWLLCEGQSVAKATYPALDAALSTLAYPWGSTATNFSVPDLRGRTIVGADGGAGRLSANDALGQVGGAEAVTLTAAQSGVRDHQHEAGTLAAASHSHSDGSLAVAAHNHLVGNTSGAIYGVAGGGAGVQTGGSLHYHDPPTTENASPAVNGATGAATADVAGSVAQATTNHAASAGDGAEAPTSLLQPYAILVAQIKT